MCAILDTSKFDNFANNKVDMRPVKEWLDKKRGKLVYSLYSDYGKEWNRKWGRSKPHSFIMDAYRDAGKLSLIPSARMQIKESRLLDKIRSENIDLKSNPSDFSILVLAHATEANLLITGDNKQSEDFKKITRPHPKASPKGRVYKNQSHKNLLKPDLCP